MIYIRSSIQCRAIVDAVLTRETTEQSVKYATKSPHVYGLGVPLVLDNLRGRISNSTAWGLRDLVPHDLGQTEVGNLDEPDTSPSSSVHEFSLVLLLFVIGALNWVGRRYNGNPLEQQVFGFDITEREHNI
jgi:hypothetical protein